MANKKMVNIQLDEVLWQRVKAAAAMAGKTLQEYVTEALRKAIGGGGQ